MAAGSVNRLTDPERRDLAQAVDGHALAVSVLAGLLTTGLPARDLASLRHELIAAARTDARVNRVLQFYAERLNEPDRYLLAALSLFARPVPAAAMLTVPAPKHSRWRTGCDTRNGRGRNTNRLDGLASWYPDGTISAHPLIRDAFRPLVLDVAPAAVETMLTGIPSGTVTSTADALRMVEAIELLLDAGQWRSADDLSLARSGSRGSIAWVILPGSPPRTARRRRIRGQPHPPPSLRRSSRSTSYELLHPRRRPMGNERWRHGHSTRIFADGG